MYNWVLWGYAITGDFSQFPAQAREKKNRRKWGSNTRPLRTIKFIFKGHHLRKSEHKSGKRSPRCRQHWKERGSSFPGTTRHYKCLRKINSKLSHVSSSVCTVRPRAPVLIVPVMGRPHVMSGAPLRPRGSLSSPTNPSLESTAITLGQ